MISHNDYYNRLFNSWLPALGPSPAIPSAPVLANISTLVNISSSMDTYDMDTDLVSYGPIPPCVLSGPLSVEFFTESSFCFGDLSFPSMLGGIGQPVVEVKIPKSTTSATTSSIYALPVCTLSDKHFDEYECQQTNVTFDVTTQLVHSASNARKVQAMRSHGVDLDGYLSIKRIMDWVIASLRDLMDAFLAIWVRICST